MTIDKELKSIKCEKSVLYCRELDGNRIEK